MAATSDASPTLDETVLSIVADLEGHDLNGLRRQWRAHLGGEPPAHLPRWLLMRVLAYRLQSDTFGGLDKSIQRVLRSEKDEDATAPFERRAPQTREGVGTPTAVCAVPSSIGSFGLSISWSGKRNFAGRDWRAISGAERRRTAGIRFADRDTPH